MQIDSLSPDAQRFLRHCGYQPSAEFDRSLSASILDTTPEDAERVLAEFDEAALLKPVPRHDRRLYLPDWLYERVKIVAAEHGDDEERLAVQRRVRRWYHLAVINVADVLDPYSPRHHDERSTSDVPRPATKDDAMQWFDIERANLSCLLAQSVEDGDIAWVWKLVAAAWPPIRKGNYNVLIDWHQLAARAAHQCHRLDVHALLLARQSYGYRDAGDLDTACSIAERACGLAVASAHRPTESIALSAAGSAHLAVGNVATADHLFTRSRQIAAKEHDTHAVALRDRHRADCAATQQQHWHRAHALYTAAAKRFGELGDAEAHARCLSKKADLLVRQGKPQQARDLAARHISTMADSGSPVDLADLYHVLATAHAALGQPAQARHYLARAAELYLAGRRPHRAHAMGTTLSELQHNERNDEHA